MYELAPPVVEVPAVIAAPSPPLTTAAPAAVQYNIPAAVTRPAEPAPTVHIPAPAPAPAPPAYIPEPAPTPTYEPAPAPVAPEPAPYIPAPATIQPATAPAPTPPAAAPTPSYIPAAGGGAPVLIYFGGKGGIGKTSHVLAAAATAAEIGLRTVVIDANRGQADIATYLRLPRTGLPTIHDAVTAGPAAALTLPKEFNAHRPTMLRPVDFALVQGPPRHLASPTDTPATVYNNVLDWARHNSELVIIDTQIIEAHKSDLFDQFIIPAMLSGAWSVAIVNETRAGADNLLDSYKELHRSGVTRDRSLIIASLYEHFDQYDQQAVEQKYGAYGRFIGSAGIDPDFKDQLNLGNIHTTSPTVAPVTRAILHQVTGDARFTAPPETSRKKRGRRGGRR